VIEFCLFFDTIQGSMASSRASNKTLLTRIWALLVDFV